MSPFGFKRKRSCKFCGKKAIMLKEYNDYYCPHCDRFQMEEEVDNVSLLPIFTLSKYRFIIQKIAFIIQDGLGTKICYGEKRDLKKYTKNKSLKWRYYFFNQVDRVVATVDSLQSISNDNDFYFPWKIYDYGRKDRGMIRYYPESKTWQLYTEKNELLSIRDPGDTKTKHNSKRIYNLVSVRDKEEILFTVKRQNNFLLEKKSDNYDPHLSWGFIIALNEVLNK